MRKTTRRRFVKDAIVPTMATCVFGSAFRRVLGANERIRVGVAGIRGRGGGHISSLQKMDGVEVAYLIDSDSALFPRRISDIEKLGGRKPKCVQDIRKALEDQGQTANTQIAVYDYGDTYLMFEVRGLNTDKYFGQGVGNTFHFEEGTVAGGKFYPKGGKDPQPLVQTNSCVATAHYSSALVHLDNTSYRLGENVAFGFKTKPFGANEAANETFERMTEHLKVNSLKLDSTKYRLGRHLKFNAEKERFVDDARANVLLTRPTRPPFAVPESVI